jgi:hypothetical protein
VTPIGHNRPAEKAVARFGETVEGVTSAGPGGNMGGQVAKAMVTRRKGALRDRIRVTFGDGAMLAFKAIHGAAHGREIVDLIAPKASVPIDPLGKE